MGGIARVMARSVVERVRGYLYLSMSRNEELQVDSYIDHGVVAARSVTQEFCVRQRAVV